MLTPVVTGLIGVGGRIRGVLGAAFLERPWVFPRIFRKTATGRYRETRAVVALVRLVRGGCPQKIYISIMFYDILLCAIMVSFQE